MTTPILGLGDLTIADVILNGGPSPLEIINKVTQINIQRTIAGASILTVDATDPDRGLLNSPLLALAAVVVLDGLSFTLVEVDKTADNLSLIFEATVVNRLRRVSGALPAAANTTTRAHFAARLVASAPGAPIPFVSAPGGTPIRETLARGTSQDPKEDTWTALNRIASEVQWRCFEVGGTIYFGPDSWLMGQAPIATIQEFEGGIEFIDLDYDVNKPLTTATITANASLWAYPPGQVVKIVKLGPGSGAWLISNVARTMYQDQTTVTVTKPQAALPEPTQTVVTTSTASVGGITNAAQSPGGLTAAGTAVAFANKELGIPYVYGAESPGVAFDCSGLTQAAYASAGIRIPRVAQDQYNAGPQVGGARKPGDLVFFGSGPSGVSHVGIYIGGGQMIDAPHTGASVRVEPIPATIGGSWGADVYVGATRPAP